MLTNPSTSPFLVAGQQINRWRVASIDPTGKRVSAQCTECGAIRTISANDLHRTNCDCRPPSQALRREIHETKMQHRARRERDWRPQR
jgi:hypothetical protein